jgi:hypothetical protein
MTLLDAKPPVPSLKIWKHVVVGLGVVVVAGAIYFSLHNYPEERAVSRFLATLEQGNYQEGYRLWQPSPSYSYDDFVHDWGVQGDYGKIRDYKVLGSRSKGAYTVIVTVRINDVDPPLDIAVDRRSKGLAYSIF